MCPAGSAGLGTRLRPELYDCGTQAEMSMNLQAVSVTSNLRLWPYASARTSVQSRFKNSKDGYI